MGTNLTVVCAAILLIPHLWLSLVLGAANILLLLWLARRAAGITLALACRWALLAIAAVTLSECWIAWSGVTAVGSQAANWVAPLRFAAAVTTFCPAMAVLGAKRPQHSAWQFVVLTLWLVLVLPAGESWLLRTTGEVEVRDARGWFLIILAVLSLANYLPTRFALSALVAFTGQALLLSGYLPLVRTPLGAGGATGALGLWLVGLTLVALGVPRRGPTRREEDRWWLDFRDAYGGLWAARVAERLNSSARQHRWPVRFQWSGLVPHTSGEAANAEPHSTSKISPPSPEEIGDLSRQEQMARRSLRGLLLRFVSAEWIAARSEKSIN